MFRMLTLSLLTVFVMLVMMPVAHAGGKEQQLNPKVLGKTYGEWSAAAQKEAKQPAAQGRRAEKTKIRK